MASFYQRRGLDVKTYSFLLPRKHIERIEAMAKENHRSRSNQLVCILDEHFGEIETDPA